jgi:predicted permease
VRERPSIWVRALFRIRALTASEEELGDVMEEYVTGRHGLLWVCRQLASLRGRRSCATVHDERAPMLSHVLTDVSYALRTFRRDPGFAAAAIAPIALGIGINTGLFSILDAIALQPVAAPRPTELVSIYQDLRGVTKRHVHGARAMFSWPEVEHYQRAARTLSGVTAYSRVSTATLAGDPPRRVGGALVACNYFDVLQIRPAIGAGFDDADCSHAAGSPAVVLTHELWTQLYGADRDVTGKTVALNGRLFAVRGVAPRGFSGIDFNGVSFFAPVSAQSLLDPGENYFRDPATSWLVIVARRRAGVTIEETRTELGLVARQIDLQQPGRTTALLVSAARAVSLPQDRREMLNLATVMLAACGLILLIASANVANLLLARGVARVKEIAVRLALGVTRGRLVQQLLTESLLVAMAGAAAGIALAQWSFGSLFVLLRSAFPDQVPVLGMPPRPNGDVLAFALLLTVTTGLVFGLLPALQASRLDVHALLNRDGGAERRRGGWMRGSLVGLQAAVCTTLLIAAALLLRAVYVTETREPGFDYRNVAVVSFDLRGAGYDGPRAAAFRQLLTDRLRSLPGVDRVAAIGKTPLSPGHSETAIRRPDQQEAQEIDFTSVSPEYFSLIGMPIVRGRTFTTGELEGQSRTVILNESAARRYFGGEDPIGRRLLMPIGSGADASLEVVGVAIDAQVVRIGDPDTSYMYLPAGYASSQRLSLLVKSASSLTALAPEIRRAARDLEPGLVLSVTPLEDNLRYWRSVSRLTAGVSGSLSALALFLAAIGVYGVVSYVVSRRVREMAIRMMLGASGADVRRLLLGQTLRPVTIGLILGIAGAAAGSRILQSVLFGVSPLDPLAFIAAPLLLLGVAAVATSGPIRQALMHNPLTALRRD